MAGTTGSTGGKGGGGSRIKNSTAASRRRSQSTQWMFDQGLTPF